MHTCLSIAGSDPSGGAGIQADLKTFSALGIYGMSAITALTAQNTMGVRGIYKIPPDFIKMQLASIFEDIPPDAVKIGMLSDPDGINAIAESLKHFSAKNIVVDPVMVSTSGSELIDEDTKKALSEKIFPLASLITPNIPEAEILTSINIKSENDMKSAAELLHEKYSSAILIKGGHSVSKSDKTSTDLLLCNDGEICIFSSERIDNPNTHGTGCTLSSAIAAGLAHGKELKVAVNDAKIYVTGAIASGLNLGRGRGPLNHGYINSK